MSENKIESLPNTSVESDNNNSTYQKRSPIWLILWPLAILLRLSNVFGVFVDGQVFLYATDSYYHLRRILFAFHNFPHVPDKDTFLNFPIGATTHWPFGFDILMAGIISCLTFGQADSWLIEAIGALLPVLIGGLLPLVVYLIAVEISDQFTALLAGILTALLPMTVHYAQIGNLDHHFLAALCQGLFFLAYLRASQEKGFLWSIIAGIILLIGFTSTTEFPFVIAIHCIFLFIVWFIVSQERQKQLIIINLKIFASVALFLLPFVFTKYFEPNGVSPLIASSWLGCFIFSLFLATLATGKKLIPYYISAIFLVLAIVFSFTFDFSSINKLLEEFRQSQGNTVIAQLIRENDPIIFAGLKALLYWESGFLLLTPITIFLLICQRSEAKLPILIGLLVMQPLTLAHERFGVLLTVPFVLGSAILAKEALLKAKEYLPKHRLGEVLVGILILLTILPCLLGINFSNPTVVIKNRSFAPLYNTFDWLKNNTPKINPHTPEYGIVTNQWDLGHWLVQFSERPTVSSPLLHTPELAQAVFDSAKIFVQPPKTAIRAIENRKLKYLLFTQDDFETLLELAGNDLKLIKQNPDLLKSLLYDSLYGQLLLSYGIGLNDPLNYQLERLRLVYETKETSKGNNGSIPVCMVFELVKGAHIKGTAKPGSLVTATTQLKTPRESLISYSSSTKTNEQGTFDLIVPYSTGETNRSKIFASSYIVKTDSAITSVLVKESQVTNGETILLETN